MAFVLYAATAAGLLWLAHRFITPLDRFSGTALDVALDEVRRRFGSTAVMRAVLLGREPGFTVPLLPD